MCFQAVPERETGLRYHTFRYYDPAGRCYTQRDPPGLEGGLYLYSYAPNPLS
ncbi:RHS repeat-associated core domain-containing protein [Kosakonia cowanii]|uniref:RHS repeat-associated core domain-containing protein n=1 Tax=Kosakonia cowanii TaxID=208223 RepID=UPI003B20DC1C